ncbi:LysR family transcriptional regulator [Paenirhodobacter populi]|uniref:LysR family transcriptional regulator n=1 Tax=Paenirhodobacter populi TaxID=2306993 RepID=UPI000FE29ED1|nr:LysR family transcriptional regulator [Sinirhodobacter populi]RWR07143.1 LysR family transcriptional regulator [Sinirhodobacter populi]
MKDVELRHLRCLVAVAEERSFSRAAMRLGTTQPSVSQLLKRLEDVLGHRLVERDRTSVALSPFGEAVLPMMRQALAAVDLAMEETRRCLRGEVGRLRIGVATLALYGKAPSLIRRFRAMYPEVEVTMTVIRGNDRIRLLLEGEIDIAFIAAAPSHPTLTQIPLSEEVLCAVLPDSHRLAGADAISLADLADNDWIMPPAGMPLHDDIVRECHRAGFEPRITAESDDFSTAFGLVLAGTGIALAGESFRDFTGPHLVLRPIRDLPLRLRHVLLHRQSQMSPTTLAFIATLAPCPG